MCAEIMTTVGYRMAYYNKPFLDSLKEVVLTIVCVKSCSVLQDCLTDYGSSSFSHIVAYYSMVNEIERMGFPQMLTSNLQIFGRFAIIALLLQLQGTAYRQWRISLWIVGAAQATVLVAHMIITLNQCSPARKLWDLQVEGTCNLQKFSQKFGYASGTVGAIADFYLAIYPALFIIGPLMKLSPQLRVGICIILGGGLVAGIAGIVKMTCINDVGQLQKDYARFVMWQL